MTIRHLSLTVGGGLCAGIWIAFFSQIHASKSEQNVDAGQLAASDQMNLKARYDASLDATLADLRRRQLVGSGYDPDGSNTGPATSLPYHPIGQPPYSATPNRSAFAASVAATAPNAVPLGGSVLDQPSASRAWLQRQPNVGSSYAQSGGLSIPDAQVGGGANNTGAINVRSGEYYAPAGPGSYVNTRNGTLYAPAGPNGVTDTRTGSYIPVAP